METTPANSRAYAIGEKMTAVFEQQLYQIPAQELCEGVMVAILTIALSAMSHEDVATWLRALAHEVENSEGETATPIWN